MSDASAVLAIAPVKFKTEYVVDPTTGEMRETDWVKWIKKGDQHKSEVWEKVSRYARLANMPGPHEWDVVGPAYEAWKKGQSLPVDGMPLEAWPGLTAEQAEALRRMNLFSLEDFASASDAVLQRAPFPNIRVMQQNARRYLEAKSRDRSIEDALAARDAVIEEMRVKLAALEAGEGEDDDEDEQEGAEEPPMLAEAPPKRRGRPPLPKVA